MNTLFHRLVLSQPPTPPPPPHILFSAGNPDITVPLLFICQARHLNPIPLSLSYFILFYHFRGQERSVSKHCQVLDG